MCDLPKHFDFTIRVNVKWLMNENKNIVANIEYDTEKTKRFLEELVNLCEKYEVKAECECNVLKQED